MSENKESAETKAVQTDRESQEYGSLHGQDTQGQETGSSSPTTTTATDELSGEEITGEDTQARAGELT